MRVSNQATYDAIKYQLSRTAADLVKANEIVTSGKRINKLSDDPIGLVQVLILRESLSNMDQLGRNISTARGWLDGAETAVGSVKGLITDMKTLAIQMANGTVGSSERSSAAAQVEGTLEQIVSLANTQVNGQYIFAGTKTDTKPFEIQRDASGNPTGVTYSGNATPFSIKIGKTTNIEVGQDGEAVFNDTYITIDSTNNKIDFTENGGASLEATVASGNYTADQLAAAVGNAMTAASSNSVTYTTGYDVGTKTFSIQDDGSLGGLQLLWNSGTNASQSIGSDLGFDPTDDTGTTSYKSDAPAQWGIFKTLIDLKGYLEDNNVDGVQRSMTRLDANFNHMISNVSDIGTKGVRLDVKEKILEDLKLSYTARKSNLEDADILAAISDVKSKETAYQAALASSAKVMRISLIDYL